VTYLAEGTSAGIHRVLVGLITVGAATVTAAIAALAFMVVVFHIEIRPVLTGSMVPTYGPGALLVTKPVPVTHLHKGMIVLFVPPGERVEFAHRITSVSGGGSHPIITTKGDANRAPDPWRAQIDATTVPEVVATVPWLGRAMVGLRGPIQIVLIVLGGLMVGVGGTRWILRSRPSMPSAVARSRSQSIPIATEMSHQ
jgi:signal peptidase I